MQGYDYSQEGAYYVTICTQDRLCLFGEVVDGEMVLNEYGKIAEEEWLNTEKIRKNIKLGAFVIMPNHLHGIIVITGRGELHSPFLPQGECNSPLRGPSNNIGAIVRGYKSSVTKQLKEIGGNDTPDGKIWQRNYYEHIVRNGNDYDRITQYILNNPMNWQQDKLYR